jgi:predicted amidophosphoribosyltransferase
MSTPPPQPLDGTTLTIKKNGLCQVCGDDASIINYGALVCSSCRTFFRRNGYHKKVYRKKLFNRKNIFFFYLGNHSMSIGWEL